MRNIAVFTCNRADESPLQPVVKELIARSDTTLWIPPYHGNITAEKLTDFGAHWLLVLGDRHELLPVCHQAIISGVSIAHIHGGETTLGSFDDKIRNAVSQLADLHFTAAQQFTDKLASMGIDPKTINTVGAPSLDDLFANALEMSEFGEGFFLVTLHPETAGAAKDYNWAMANSLIEALEKFPDRRIVVTGTNSDPGNREIKRRLQYWARENHPRVFYHESLGRRRYLTAMKHAACVIGNSSSGIIEAPALGTPTVNIGRRQEGRPMVSMIYKCPKPEAHDIEIAINCAIKHRHERSAIMPYGSGGASKKIAETLATWRL